jgi:heme oxygenase
MGTFAKRLGQLAARSLESESSQILRSGAANKRGLSLALDGTLRKSHDMKVFGLGTLASLSSRERYSRFTASMHAVYSAMEGRLDASKSAPTQRLWSRFGPQLRRGRALAADLHEAIGADGASIAVTPATASYVAAIGSAADDDDANDGARLVGHLYCRYFADLFGGQGRAPPTRLALGLGPHSPRHYTFDFGEFGGRRALIEALYEEINTAGERLRDDDQRAAVVREAELAFAHNVDVYREEGRLVGDSVVAAAKLLKGYVAGVSGR